MAYCLLLIAYCISQIFLLIFLLISILNFIFIYSNKIHQLNFVPISPRQLPNISKIRKSINHKSMNVQTTDISQNSHSELKYFIKNKIINQYAYFDTLSGGSSSIPLNSLSNINSIKYTDNIENSFNNNNQRNELLNRDSENFPNLPINIKYPNLSSKHSLKNGNSLSSKKPSFIQSPKNNNINEKLEKLQLQYNFLTEKKPEISNQHINQALLNSNSKITSEEDKNINILSIGNEKPLTPLRVKYAVSDIFDKKLGMKLNMVNSPHKNKMDSFNIDMNELQMFIFGNKYYENETEEEKKYRKEETKKKIQNEFLLKDMKKKVFFLKNIIDYVYPKVIVGKVNSQVEAVKIKNRQQKSKSLGNIKINRNLYTNNNNKFMNKNKNKNNNDNYNNFIIEEEQNITYLNNLMKNCTINNNSYSNNYINNSTFANNKNYNNNNININKPDFLKNLHIRAKQKRNDNITIEENVSMKSSENLMTLNPNDYYTINTMESKQMAKINTLKKKSNNLTKKFNSLNLMENISDKTDSIFNPEFTSLINRSLIGRNPSFKITDNNDNSASNINRILCSDKSSHYLEDDYENKRNSKEKKNIDFVENLLKFNSKVTHLNDAIRRETEGVERKLNFDTNPDEGKRYNFINNMFTDDSINSNMVSNVNSNVNFNLEKGFGIRSLKLGKSHKKLKIINPLGIINYQNFQLNPK